MKRLTMKFGGTCLGSNERLHKVADVVRAQMDKGFRPIVVASAISPLEKRTGTTSNLMESGARAMEGKPYQEFVDIVRNVHMSILYKSLVDTDNIKRTESELQAQFNRIESTCEYLFSTRYHSPQALDFLVGAGERLSCTLLSAFFSEQINPSYPVHLSHVFLSGDDERLKLPWGCNPGIVDPVKTYVRQVMEQHTEESIPVITGHLGYLDNGILGSIGRGYTDVTASLIANVTGSDELQVWKESDGVFTANPTKFDNAKLLTHVTINEFEELTHSGNDVVHPSALEFLSTDKIPIFVGNVFDLQSPGTRIVYEEDDSIQDIMASPGPRAIACHSDVQVLTINYKTQFSRNPDMMRLIFEKLYENGVGVLFQSMSQSTLSLVLHPSTTAAQRNAVTDAISSNSTITCLEDKAMISVIGEGMKSAVGTASKIFEILASEGINTEMIAQGTSETAIAVLVDNKDKDAFISALHTRLLNLPLADPS